MGRPSRGVRAQLPPQRSTQPDSNPSSTIQLLFKCQEEAGLRPGSGIGYLEHLEGLTHFLETCLSTQAFGFKVSHEVDFPDFTLSYLRNEESPFEIELTLNKGRAEPYTHGTGERSHDP